jgi:hypothetical protein
VKIAEVPASDEVKEKQIPAPKLNTIEDSDEKVPDFEENLEAPPLTLNNLRDEESEDEEENSESSVTVEDIDDKSVHLEGTAWNKNLVRALEQIGGVSYNPEADRVIKLGNKLRTTRFNSWSGRTKDIRITTTQIMENEIIAYTKNDKELVQSMHVKPYIIEEAWGYDPERHRIISGDVSRIEGVLICWKSAREEANLSVDKIARNLHVKDPSNSSCMRTSLQTREITSKGMYLDIDSLEENIQYEIQTKEKPSILDSLDHKFGRAL